MTWYEIECDCGAIIEVEADCETYRCEQCKLLIRVQEGEIQSFESDHITRGDE